MPSLSDYVDYIPVPLWDGVKWRPVNLSRTDDGFLGYLDMPWPDWFDPSTLKPPKFHLDEYVSFRWSGRVVGGVVKRISKSGGAITGYELPTIREVAAERYARPPQYDVVWNAHIRWVGETSIIPG